LISFSFGSVFFFFVTQLAKKKKMNKVKTFIVCYLFFERTKN